jgi:hypothetical protein
MRSALRELWRAECAVGWLCVSLRTLLTCVMLGQLHTASAAEGVQLDLNGQIRERFESSVHPGFGLAEPGSDDYLLNRVLLGAQAKAGEHVALTGQIVSGSVTGADTPMAGTQDDPLDVLELFADGTFNAAGGNLRLRAGRQSLAFGAARLVSTRESTNARRTFDGVRATWTHANAHLDAFYLQPVAPRAGVFDDQATAAQSVWGFYFTRDDGAQPVSAGYDLYYLGVRNGRATFAFESAREVRHTVGAHVFGASHRRDWNIEAAWQWGSFGASHISAWTLSSDVGYTLSTWSFTPRVGIKADVISGDRDPHDGKLATFNPLFPKLTYFSDANVITPANLFDVQPTLGLTFTEALRVTGGWNVLWRYSREDAFYLPPLKPVTSVARSARRYIGQQWASTLEWKVRSRVTVAAAWVAFRPGSALRGEGGSRGRFFFASVQRDF